MDSKFEPVWCCAITRFFVIVWEIISDFIYNNYEREGTMKNIKRSLFGYNQKEVDNLVLSLERENKHLKQELLGKTEANE